MTKTSKPKTEADPRGPQNDEERMLISLYRELPWDMKVHFLKATVLREGAEGMEEMILSEEEVALVMKRRAAAAALDEAELFRINVIKQAAAWLEFSGRTGEGLTFSTFVNTFGCQHKDCQAVYRHLEMVLKAAYPSGSPT